MKNITKEKVKKLIENLKKAKMNVQNAQKPMASFCYYAELK